MYSEQLCRVTHEDICEENNNFNETYTNIDNIGVHNSDLRESISLPQEDNQIEKTNIIHLIGKYGMLVNSFVNSIRNII